MWTAHAGTQLNPSVAIYRDRWIVGAMLAALILRLTNLDAAALWLDETITVTWIRLPWPEMLRSVMGDNHLPLYPALIKAWATIAGTAPWALRLPSVICSWATVPLIAAAAYVLLGPMQARWAAWLSALSPYLLQHAQEGRMYALLGLLSATSLLQLAQFMQGRSQRLGLWFFTINLCLLLTHYYSVFLVGGQWLVLLLLRRQQWRGWITAMTASSALVLACLLSARYLAYPQAGGHYDIGSIAFPGVIWSLITGYVLMPSSAELHTMGLRAAFPYLPAAAVLLAALTLISLASVRSIGREALTSLLLLSAAVISGPFLVAMLFDVAINPRYAVAAVPASIVFLAAGCARATQTPRQWAGPVALLGCMLVASALHLRDPGHGREDVYAAARWLDENVPADEPIFVTSDEMAMLARFHWPSRALLLYPGKRVVVHKGNAQQVAGQLPTEGRQKFIYVFARDWLSDPDGHLRAALRANYDSCPGTQVRGIEILCFRKRDA